MTLAPQTGCSFNLGGGSSYATFIYDGAIEVYQAANQDAQFIDSERVLTTVKVAKPASTNYINFGIANYESFNDQSVRIVVFKQSALFIKSALLATVGLVFATSLF